MKLSLVCCGIILLLQSFAFAQSKSYVIHQDTIVFNMQLVNGVGPMGQNSFGIGSYDEVKNTEEFKAYPVMKNIPGSLTNVVQYFYILNHFQFFYQNYCASIYNKAILLKEANKEGWVLADTVKLSRTPLLCFVSVLAGIDQQKNEVAIIDANNNGDFADDVIKPLSKNVYDEALFSNLSVLVKTTYLSGKEIKEKEMPVFLERSRNPQQLALTFMFPEFNYTRFKYQGKSYMMCTSANLTPFICILSDRPYFMRVSNDQIIRINHFVKIGNSNFKFINYDPNAGKVTLTGISVNGFSDNGSVTEEKEEIAAGIIDTVTSDQVGFRAPLISGENINQSLSTGMQISTAGWKGKYIFVDFWSTYCGPCILELPYLREAYLKYKRDKFEIIGVFDERDKAMTQTLFKKNKVIWPNVEMNSKSTQISGYGHINSFPTSYLIDPTGKIVAYNLRGDALMNKLRELIN